MRFFTLVFKNVTHRRIRSGLTVTGMAIAVAAVVALVGVADGFKRSFLELYQGRGVDIVVVRARVADRMTSVLDASMADQIAQIPGVASVEPTLLDAVSFEDLGLYGVVVQGLRPGARLTNDHNRIAGRDLRQGDRRVVMLGRILADNLDKQVGDRVEIYEEEFFDVVGIYDRFNIFENGAMIMPIGELQRLLGQQGHVSAFNVIVTDGTDPDLIRRTVDQINEACVGVSAMATDDYVGTDAKIQGATAMAWTTSSIALMIGAIGMLNTMLVSVFERTAEIGVLRAIGWRKSRIVWMVMLESCLLCLIGAVLGTALALVLTDLLSRLPTSSTIVSGRVAPLVVVQGFVIAFSIGLLGATYPAYRAATLLPTEAIRHHG